MEAEDYKTLLKQAEDELGATPGAYCSRKVALRALELLREAGQKEFDEADKKWAEVGQQAVNNLKAYVQTIERQAQAIRRLEEEKTRGGLGQARNSPMGDGILAQIERNKNVAYIGGIDPITGHDIVKEMFMDPAHYVDKSKSPILRRNAGDEYMFRKTLNNKLDQLGKPWTEY